MYLERGGLCELFIQEMIYEGVKWVVGKLDCEGYEVIVVMMVEYVVEWQVMICLDGSLIEGVYLYVFLGDVVSRFWCDYLGVFWESVLEVVSLFCMLVLEGEKDFQLVLLDEVYVLIFVGGVDWCQDMLMVIVSRNLEVKW